MTARLLMDPHPNTLRPDDTIERAAREIMAHRYRSLPVVDDKGRYLGVLGINCLLYLVLPRAATMKNGLSSVPYIPETLESLHKRLHQVASRSVMTCVSKDLPVVRLDTPLLETLLVLYRTQRSIPVVDEETGRLEGMISYFDVGAKIMGQNDKRG